MPRERSLRCCFSFDRAVGFDARSEHYCAIFTPSPLELHRFCPHLRGCSRNLQCIGDGAVGAEPDSATVRCRCRVRQVRFLSSTLLTSCHHHRWAPLFGHCLLRHGLHLGLHRPGLHRGNRLHSQGLHRRLCAVNCIDLDQSQRSLKKPTSASTTTRWSLSAPQIGDSDKDLMRELMQLSLTVRGGEAPMRQDAASTRPSTVASGCVQVSTQQRGESFAVVVCTPLWFAAPRSSFWISLVKGNRSLLCEPTGGFEESGACGAPRERQWQRFNACMQTPETQRQPS